MLVTDIATTENPPQFFVQEKKTRSIIYEEFLEAFYPEMHKQIDFGKITFLSSRRY